MPHYYFDLVDDAGAEIDRKADHLLSVVEIGKRDGRIAVAERDDTTALDLLECVRLVLRMETGAGAEAGEDRANQDLEVDLVQ